MTDEEAAVWLELAPHAVTASTLVPAMVPAFVRLCRAVVKLQRWERQIAADGDTYLKVVIDGAGSEHTEVKAHPLLSRAAALEQAIRAWMKDFAINPFGRPVDVPQAEEDPFAQFDEKGA